MLPYNTDLEPMKLPEYGRNVQRMVEFCKTLPDREQRNLCARTIAGIMADMFPAMVGENNDYSKIWDHINILADFDLDIDFPCEVVSEEKLHPVPERIPYTASKIKYRYYGKNIEKMIAVVSEMEPGPERDAIIDLIAPHMKKLMLFHNKEGVSDAKVLHDLQEFSEGRITLDPSTYLMHEFKEVKKPTPTKSKKKRK